MVLGWGGVGCGDLCFSLLEEVQGQWVWSQMGVHDSSAVQIIFRVRNNCFKRKNFLVIILAWLEVLFIHFM